MRPSGHLHSCACSQSGSNPKQNVYHPDRNQRRTEPSVNVLQSTQFSERPAWTVLQRLPLPAFSHRPSLQVLLGTAQESA